MAQKTMENDIRFDTQRCRQALQFLGLITVTDDVQAVIAIGLLGDEAGKLLDNPVHLLALHKL